MKDRCLILMVRSPRKGTVKSRLSLEIGEDAALEIYRGSALDLLRILDGIDTDILIGFHPRSDLAIVKEWLGKDRSFIAQTGEDLGARQASLLCHAFRIGYGKAAVMISDGPDIPAENIKNAFELLDEADAVIGPCYDGGYYLVGFKNGAYSETIFSHMDWSNETVTQKIKERMGSMGIHHAVLPKWWDIDVLEDLKEYRERVQRTGGQGVTYSFIEKSGVLDDL